jgi:hypothetical protein
VATFALSESQGEPESPNGIHQVDLFYIAQADGVQAHIGNQLLNLGASFAAGTTVEEVCLDAVKDGIGEVFPAR